MELTQGQLEILTATGHLLITGGPGSGKTTVSILKAAKIAEQALRSGQKILFLSFARASVSRVIEAIEHEQKIPVAQKRFIEVDTYHSFFWQILKTHGYLVGLPRKLSILTPPAEAVALSDIRSEFRGTRLTDAQKAAKADAESSERIRLAHEEGRICFDLFALYVAQILHGSMRIRRLLATMYPVIILDEFQDTNNTQWDVVQALGLTCQLIALADPEQQIYEWIGADPARLDHFREAFLPAEVDLSTDNHRSAGTDIAVFGNDLLTGKFGKKEYNGIALDTFDSFPNPAMTKLVTTVYAARGRLLQKGVKDWSLAILVPTKKMTRLVSDALRVPPAGMTEVPHSAVIDMDGAVLAAEVIAFLIQSKNGQKFELAQFIELMCHYFQGKGGDEPTRGALDEAAGIQKAYDALLKCQITGNALRGNSRLIKMLNVYKQVSQVEFSGNPYDDWLVVRRILEEGECPRLQEIAAEVRNIRILGRGSQLRQALSEDWRENRGYDNALTIVRQAFVQEHFSTNAKPESGVVVMNMHKAKGKQFDKVIIFEGWPIRQRGTIISNSDRIVRANRRENANNQARQNFRVSVTRSRFQTVILTPADDRCVLLHEIYDFG